jgi:hypothetical protein
MSKILIALILSTVAVPVARAEAGRFVTADREHLDKSKAAILCDAKADRFRIYGIADKHSIDAAYPERLLVDYRALMVAQPGRHFEDEPWRGWSRRISTTCGRYTIELEAGFYNINPMGRMGAAEEYPKAAVSTEDFLVVGWTTMAPCAYASLEGLSSNAAVIEARWLAKDQQTEITRKTERCEGIEPTRTTSRAKTLKQLLHTRP